METLPRELIVHIFSLLDVLSLTRCARVNHTWSALTSDTMLWKNRCVMDGFLPALNLEDNLHFFMTNNKRDYKQHYRVRLFQRRNLRRLFSSIQEKVITEGDLRRLRALEEALDVYFPSTLSDLLLASEGATVRSPKVMVDFLDWEEIPALRDKKLARMMLDVEEDEEEMMIDGWQWIPFAFEKFIVFWVCCCQSVDEDAGERLDALPKWFGWMVPFNEFGNREEEGCESVLQWLEKLVTAMSDARRF